MLGDVRFMSVKDTLCTGHFLLFQQAFYFVSSLFSARA